MEVLDVRRLLCPLPVIKLQQALQKLTSQAKIEVLATDAGVLYDIPTWCRLYGHSVLSIEQTKEYIKILVQKK